VPAKARYGREATMARLGVELLGRSDLSVLIWRPGDAATDRYDVVVAADVIGQFRDPHVDFTQLFSRLDPAGLVICSTQIYAGGDLDRQRYVFGPGHASYYSRESLRRIAAAHQLQVHLRVPTVSAENHRRRRNVIFTRRHGARPEAAPGSTHPNAPV
jgi:Methyltransferase domain